MANRLAPLGSFARSTLGLCGAFAIPIATLSLVTGREVNEALPVNVLVCAAAMLASVFVHELGHAAVGRLCGLHPVRIYLGHGPGLWRRKILGVDLRLQATLFGGATLLVPRTNSYRLRMWVAIAAGPASNAAILVLALASGGVASILRLGGTVSLAGAVGAANALALAVALAPIRAHTAMGTFGTDGYRLAASLFVDDPSHPEALAAALDADDARSRKDFAQALAICQTGLDRHPGDLHLENVYALLLLDTHRFQEARTVLTRILERPDTQPAVRFVVENNLAWAAVQLGDGYEQEALEYAERALRFHAKASWAHGTCGAALVRAGQLDRGLKLLRYAFSTNTEPQSRAHNACWLSVAESKRGDPKAARSWLETARELDPTSYSLRFAETAFADAGRVAVPTA